MSQLSDCLIKNGVCVFKFGTVMEDIKYLFVRCHVKMVDNIPSGVTDVARDLFEFGLSCKHSKFGRRISIAFLYYLSMKVLGFLCSAVDGCTCGFYLTGILFCESCLYNLSYEIQ